MKDEFLWDMTVSFWPPSISGPWSHPTEPSTDNVLPCTRCGVEWQ